MLTTIALVVYALGAVLTLHIARATLDDPRLLLVLDQVGIGRWVVVVVGLAVIAIWPFVWVYATVQVMREERGRRRRS